MGLVCFPTFSIAKARFHYFSPKAQITMNILVHTQTVDFLSNTVEKKIIIFLFSGQNG